MLIDMLKSRYPDTKFVWLVEEINFNITDPDYGWYHYGYCVIEADPDRYKLYQVDVRFHETSGEIDDAMLDQSLNPMDYKTKEEMIALLKNHGYDMSCMLEGVL